MAVIARAMIIKGLNAAIGVVSPKVVTMLIVVMYDLWAGEELDPARVVKVISWSELLRMGVFTFLSNAAQFGTEMFTSVKRIQVRNGFSKSRKCDCPISSVVYDESFLDFHIALLVNTQYYETVEMVYQFLNGIPA